MSEESLTEGQIVLKEITFEYNVIFKPITTDDLYSEVKEYLFMVHIPVEMVDSEAKGAVLKADIQACALRAMQESINSGEVNKVLIS